MFILNSISRLQTPDALVRSSDSLSNDLNYISKNGSISISLYVKTKTENQDVLNDLLEDFQIRNFINIITKRNSLSLVMELRLIKYLGHSMIII